MIGRCAILSGGSAKVGNPVSGKNAFAESSGSWSSYWKAQTDLLLFFGEVKNISGGKLYNQMKGSSDYMTVGGSAGSYTFQVPNTAPYITADTDYIWFKADASQRTTTEAELIGYDLPRTPVKYDNASPNAIRWIGIKKATVIFTTAQTNKLFQGFQLPIEWANNTNAYGYIKSNRTGQNLCVAESVYVQESIDLFNRMTAISETPSDTRKTIINTAISADKIDYGFTNKYDCFYLLAAHGIASCKLNIIKDLHNITFEGSPSFTIDKKVKGNGFDAVLNLNYNASTQAIKFLRDAHSFGIYLGTDEDSGVTRDLFIGKNGGAMSYIGNSSSGNSIVNSMNTGTATYITHDIIGMWIVVRENATLFRVYHDGVEIGDGYSVNSFAITNWYSVIGCNYWPGFSGEFSNKDWLLSFIGGYMSSSEVAKFQTNWVNGYLHNIAAL